MTRPDESNIDFVYTPRTLAEDLVDGATGSRGVYHGVPVTLRRRRAETHGLDVDEVERAFIDVRRERGFA